MIPRICFILFTFILFVLHEHSSLIRCELVSKLPSRQPSVKDAHGFMQHLKLSHPDKVHLLSIGKSVQKQDLFILRLSGLSSNQTSTNATLLSEMSSYIKNRSILRPTVRFIGTIHGNEPLGTYLLLRLAEDLLENPDNDLLNSLDVEILPIANPDGRNQARPGDCTGVRVKNISNGRENSLGYDLESDFNPNFEPAKNLSNFSHVANQNVQPETLSIMSWMAANPSFVLGSTIHTGNLVVSYPFDGVPAITSDNALFKSLSASYVKNYLNKTKLNEGCSENDDFFDSTVIGNAWSKIESKFLIICSQFSQ